MTRKKTYQYPWRHNNNFELLTDGDAFIPSMLREIKNADEVILFEAYLVESGKTADLFINEFIQANSRGIKVYLLLDEYGAKNLNEKDKNRLIKSGINLVLYNPVSLFNFGKSLKRDHRKLLCIDNKTAFIGGAGITDEFNPELNKQYWHDVMLKISGEIIQDLSHSFHDLREKQQLQPVKNSSSQGNNGTNKARVLLATGVDKNEIARSIVSRIRSSSNRVWLMSPYFISSWKIRRAIRAAARKGIDVRLVFPGQHSDHKWVRYGVQRYYHRLLKANVKVYEYQPRFNHAKVILCDDWYTIGSSNLDRWNQYLNLDLNIEVIDTDSLNQIIELFEKDIAESNAVTLKQWKARSLLQQIKEKIAGILIGWLSAISRKFRR